MQLIIIFLHFSFVFWVTQSSRANHFFSGLADIILGQFQRQKMVLNIFLEWVYLRGSNFTGKIFKSFSNEYILFSLFDCFSFSTFWDDIACALAGIVQLICLSGRVLLSFSFNSWNCISGLVLLCDFTAFNANVSYFRTFQKWYSVQIKTSWETFKRQSFLINLDIVIKFYQNLQEKTSWQNLESF